MNATNTQLSYWFEVADATYNFISPSQTYYFRQYTYI